MSDVKCGKCGHKVALIDGTPKLVCLRCGFVGNEKDHIQERDRRVEAAFLARATGPGQYLHGLDLHGTRWPAADLCEIAEKDIAALDQAAQRRTA